MFSKVSVEQQPDTRSNMKVKLCASTLLIYTAQISLNNLEHNFKKLLKVLFVVAAILIATVASNAVNYPKPAYPAPAYPSYTKSYDYVSFPFSSFSYLMLVLLTILELTYFETFPMEFVCQSFFTVVVVPHVIFWLSFDYMILMISSTLAT